MFIFSSNGVIETVWKPVKNQITSQAMPWCMQQGGEQDGGLDLDLDLYPCWRNFLWDWLHDTKVYCRGEDF